MLLLNKTECKGCIHLWRGKKAREKTERDREGGGVQNDGDQRKTKLPGDLLSLRLFPHSLFPSPLFSAVSEGLNLCASRSKHAIGHLIGWLNNHPASLQARQRPPLI